MPLLEIENEIAYTSALLFNVGTLGAVPLGFGELLAEEFVDTQFLSSETIRNQILTNRPAGDRAKEVRREYIAKRMMKVAAPILEAGNDFYTDVFFNSPNSRLQAPVALGQKTEALCIALNIQTQSKIVRKRKQAWRDAGILSLPPANKIIVPSSDSNLERTPPIVFATQQESGIDYAFNLNGGTSPEGLLEQLEEQFDKNELLGN